METQILQKLSHRFARLMITPKEGLYKPSRISYPNPTITAAVAGGGSEGRFAGRLVRRR